MEIIEGKKTAELPALETVVTVGKFDGLHLGHQKIFRTLLEEKRRPGALLWSSRFRAPLMRNSGTDGRNGSFRKRRNAAAFPRWGSTIWWNARFPIRS